MVPSALSRGRSSFRPTAAFCLVTAVLAGGCSAHPAPYDRSGEVVTPDHVAAGARHGLIRASLTVADAASRVEIRLATLPGLLYRVSTPAGSGLAPQVGGPAGRLQLRLRPTGDDGPDTVTVLLDRSVRWSVATPRGAGEQLVDLRAGRMTSVALGAAGRVDLLLPRPHGVVPIVLTGPVGSLALTAPKGTPVRLRLPGRARTTSHRARAASERNRRTTARTTYVVTARQAVTTVTTRN